MKKVRFLVTLCILLIAGAANAQQQVSINEAKRAAVQSLNLRQNNGFTRDETNIKKVNTRQNEVKQTLMYEVIFDEKQGVLLSGSKACLPVLGFFTVSDENRSVFDDDAPCGLKSMLWEYEEQIALCFKNDTIQLYEEEAWQRLQSNVVTRASPGAVDIVSPLITSKWNQTDSNDGECDAYNYYVPNSNGKCSCSSDGGVKCPAGCVAVAMAQIMNFWKYPVYHPLIIEQFDWCNMPDELRTASPNYIKERNAIARLIRDCGAKVNMKYCDGDCGSSASSSDARDALVDFGYSSNAVYFHRTYAPGDSWKLLIKDNLNAWLPVYYRGEHSNGGHAFICDGYDSNDFFHFNWGWGGWRDNWFTLNNLNPNNTYNSSQAAIINLLPSGYQNYCNFSIPLSTYYNNCYNIWNMFVTFPPPHQNVPQTFTVLESASASSPASWRTIEPGQTVTYTAHEQVILKPGFHAKAGSNFTARIEPCPGCQGGRTSPDPTTIDRSIIESAFNINESDDLSNRLVYKNEDNDDTLQKILPDNHLDFIIYPNPNDGNFTLIIDTKEIQPFFVEIFNSFGMLVSKTEYSNVSQININHSGLPQGIYFVKLSMDNNVSTKKVIIQ